MRFAKIRKKFGWYNLRKEGAKWVEKNFGSEYVQEFCEKYDKLNRGIPIGGMVETMAFVDLVEKIKEEI